MCASNRATPEREIDMLISEKQQKANRRNAQRSSGPKTSAGKAAASRNALTYGLRARTLILPEEDPGEYRQLCADLETEWQPQTSSERFYLEMMSTSHWLLARADSSERRIHQMDLRLDMEGALLDRVAARRARLQRSYTAAMHELQQLQKQRQAQRPQPAQSEARQTQPTAPAGQPPTPPPGYVMSDAAEDHPAFRAPAATDTR
jgi:hypothetical protein